MSGYEDIIHLPYPRPSQRQRLSQWQRSAQFSPFAALTGLENVVAEEGRLTQSPVELAEDAGTALNAQLSRLQAQLDSRPVITVAWFCPDKRKEGGSYVTTQGCVKKLDEIAREMVFQQGPTVPLASILWILGI